MKNHQVEKSNISLLPLREVDIPAIGAVHRDAFPGSLLTRVGGNAVERYYRWLVLGPHEVVATGAWRDGVLVGFCFSGRFRGALGGFLSANRVYLACRLARRFWLLTDAECRDRLRAGVSTLMRRFRGRLRRGRLPAARRADLSSPGLSTYGILSIAVSSKGRRGGIGRALMAECECRAIASDVREIDLTVSPDNLPAVEFYLSLGWRRSSAGPGWTGRMLKDLAAVSR